MYEIVIVEKTIATKPQWLLGLLVPKADGETYHMVGIARFGTRVEAVQEYIKILDQLAFQRMDVEGV